MIGALFHAFLGAITGLIIGATNATDDAGSIVGIVASILALGLQYFLGGRTGIGLILGLFFAVGVGKAVGAGIANKVQGA